MSDDRVKRWLDEIRVLDGGMGSECQRRSHLSIDGHRAWSCLLLKEDPNLVCDIHKSYIRAGSDVISTNTYQAAPRTLADAMGIEVRVAVELMKQAVRLARRAISAVSEENTGLVNQGLMVSRKLPILVAGSLGPYGACLADGSEYTGNYAENMSIEELVEFHLERAKILLEAGVDFIAWETIPILSEVSAICEVMRRLPGALAWLSVASQNGQTAVGGDPLYQIAFEVDKCDQIFGIGVNCIIDHDCIGKALSNLSIRHDSCESGTEDGFHPPPCSVRSNCPGTSRQLDRKLLVLYANSGEKWVPPPGNSRKRQGHWIWPNKKGPNSWAQLISAWSMRRESESGEQSKNAVYPLAQWVGGCCRVSPFQIRQLAERIKPDEYFCAPGSYGGNTSTFHSLSAFNQLTVKHKLKYSRSAQRKQPPRACKRPRSD